MTPELPDYIDREMNAAGFCEERLYVLDEYDASSLPDDGKQEAWLPLQSALEAAQGKFQSARAEVEDGDEDAAVSLYADGYEALQRAFDVDAAAGDLTNGQQEQLEKQQARIKRQLSEMPTPE